MIIHLVIHRLLTPTSRQIEIHWSVLKEIIVFTGCGYSKSFSSFSFIRLGSSRCTYNHHCKDRKSKKN